LLPYFPRVDNQNIAQNETFVLNDPQTRKTYERAYEETSALYYGGKPTFHDTSSAVAVLAEF